MSKERDPVCGKEVDTLRARAVGIFGGVTYYFCSADCKAKFSDPRKSPRPPSGAAPLGGVPVVAEKARAEPEPESKGPAEESVKYARSKPKRPPEPEPEAEAEAEAVKRDPSPSVEAEVDAIKGGGKAWVVVLLLFVVAGVVLFYAFRK
jgi:YHS domain-containing protein